MERRRTNDELLGLCPSHLVLEDGLAMSHLHQFLSQEKRVAAMDDVFLQFDIKNADRLKEAFGDPEKVKMVRGGPWLEEAVAQLLEHEGPIAPALVYALWRAVTERLEHTVMATFRASKEWNDYTQAWLGTQRSATREAGCHAPGTVPGILRCGFAASRLLRFTESIGVGESDVLLSLDLLSYNDARGTKMETIRRELILDYFRPEPAAVKTNGSEELRVAIAKDAAVRHTVQRRHLLDQGMMSEEEWEAGTDTDDFPAWFLCRLKELVYLRLDADVMASFVASEEYRTMLLKSPPKPLEEHLERHHALKLETEVASLVSLGVSHVIFDFDKTLVAEHLGSGIPVHQVETKRITPASAHIVCAALRAGMEVGIATFSDDQFAESDHDGTGKEHLVSGEALVRQVIANSIGALATARIRIVAAYPDVLRERGVPCSCGVTHCIPDDKHYHLHKLYPGLGKPHGIPARAVLFFDDNQGNTLRAEQEFVGITAVSPYDEGGGDARGITVATWSEAMERFQLAGAHGGMPQDEALLTAGESLSTPVVRSRVREMQSWPVCNSCATRIPLPEGQAEWLCHGCGRFAGSSGLWLKKG